ncbi:MAG: hypothetical protein R3D27_02760 [Hyphomicrobiaceae bacterium]
MRLQPRTLRHRQLDPLSARLALIEDRGGGMDDGAATWPYWPAALVLALAWLAFSWPWLSGAVTIPWDAKAHFAPQVQFLARSIHAGEWPFWTPNVFAGQAQIADPQSMMFAPPMLALALATSTPSLWAIDATVLGVLLMAGLGTLWLARDLGWHWAGALLAALATAFGASMAWRLQHFGQVMSLAWLPFALVMLRRALDRGSPAWGAAAGLVAAFITLGRDQVALLALYVLAGYVLWHLANAERRGAALARSLAPLTAGAIVGALIVVLPILMTALLAQQSNRPTIDFAGAGAGSLHPALLVTTAIPHLFGAAGEMADYWGPPSYTWRDTGLFIAQNMGQLYLGAIPFLTLAAGIATGAYFRREIGFYTVALALVLLYALGWYTPLFRLAYDVLPGVPLYRRPADATFVVGFLAAMLAGYALHRMASAQDAWPSASRLALMAAIVALPFALALIFAYDLDRMAAASRPLALAALWFGLAGAVLAVGWWIAPIRPIAAGLVVIVAAAGDLAFNNGPNGASALPTPVLAMLEPETASPTIRALKQLTAASRSETRRDRVELAGLGFHWPNASLTHDLENTLGYNPVRLGLYSAATGAGDTVGLPDQRRFTALMPSYRSLLADLLGLRYIATGVRLERIDPRARPGDFPLVAATGEGWIYENPRAYPRVLFATRAIAAEFDRILASGVWPVQSLLDTVLLEPGAEGTDETIVRRPGTVAIESYRNTEVAVITDSPDGGWLVLNDVWQPWWQAEVDGTSARLLRANVLVRAVAVPAGRHRVRFVFRPIRGALSQAANLMAAGGRR